MRFGWLRLPFTGTTPYEPLATDPGQTEFDMGSEEQSVISERRKGDLWAWYLAASAAAIILSLTWWTVLSEGPSSYNLFTFHPLLMTLATAIIVYAILTLQETSQPKTKVAGLARHQFANLYLAFPAIALGAIAIVSRKQLNSVQHFTTWHGTFGLTTVLYVICQILIGGGSVWFGGAFFGGGAKAKAIWKYHRLSGYILFTLLLLTVHLGGGWSSWSTSRASPFARRIAYSVEPVVLLLAVFSRVRLSKLRFF